MALTALYPDGKTGTAEIDSWTTAEEFASTLLQERGITDSLGWSVTLTEHDTHTEVTYLDYVLDLIGEKELPPAFPLGTSSILHSDNYPQQNLIVESRPPPQLNEFEESPLVARKTRSPPPLTRKLSREALAEHDSRNSDGDETIGLSRTSALNNRYFDDKSKSKSLDDLLNHPNNIQQEMGLSRSKLNERYHSMERLDTNTFTRAGPSVLHEFDQLESVSQMDVDSDIVIGGSRLVSGKGLEGSKMWSKFPLMEDRAIMENGDLKPDYPKSVSSRFIKAGNAGRKAYTGGSSSSRAHIERGDYTKSSAMSDTSETPSLASHVRRVRVPSQASDVDQFLDDLFMPVLDHQLDELSDARSLAASIKGGKREDASAQALQDLDQSVSFSRCRGGSLKRQSLLSAYEDIPVFPSVSDLCRPSDVVASLKGGGGGAAEVETNASSAPSNAPLGYYTMAPGTSGGPGSPPPFNPLTTVPLYSPGGIAFPGILTTPSNHIDPNQFASYQQNLQRAFLQSAVAQNIQIQQHLMAQNQALQQLIQQNTPVSFQEPEQMELWSAEKTRMSSREGVHSMGSRGHIISPPPTLIPLGSPFASGGLAFNQAMAASSPLPDQLNKKHSGTSDDTGMSFEMSPPLRGGNPRSPQPYLLDLSGENNMSGVPPPPPMPHHLQHQDGCGNYVDPYERAKTVRIGKWRWPPPKEDTEGADSFLHFKLNKNIKKSSKSDYKEDSKSGLKDESGEIEWEEFEFAEARLLLNSANENASNERSHSHYIDQGQGHQLPSRSQNEPHSGQHTGHHPSFLASPNYPFKDANGNAASDGFLAKKQHQMQYHKAVKQQRLQKQLTEKTEANEWNEAKSAKDNRKRRDSWDSDVDEDEQEGKTSGIGKLKIPREMRQKLEALTSSHPSRVVKGEIKHSKDRGVKKLEQNRRSLLQQQLEGDRWDAVDSSRGANEKSQFIRPPSPIAPNEARKGHKIHSPPGSVSSQESYPVIPHTRSPPPPIIPQGYGLRGGDGAYHSKERRGSISTIQTEKTEQIEIEESSEFLMPVDRAPRLKDEEKVKKTVEAMKTRLLPPLQGAHLAYGKVPWTISIRKEIFTPNEVLSPEALHLVFCQVVLDVYSGTTKRLSVDELARLKQLLEEYGITPNNTYSSHHKRALKRDVVEQAKKCPLYFASIFTVTGSKKIEAVELLAISHTGVRILKRSDGEIKIIETYSFEDIEEAKCTRSGSLHLVLSSGSGIVLYCNQAKQVSQLLMRFLTIIHSGSRDFVKAVADYVTREPSLLSFRKGDIIKVTSCDAQYLDKGWLQGVLDGRSGMFPIEYVTKIGRTEARLASKVRGLDSTFSSEIVRESTKSPEQETASPRTVNGEGTSPTTWNISKSSSPHLDDSDHSSGGEGVIIIEEITKVAVDDGKHSLFQFALQHFRGAKESGIADGSMQLAAQKAKKKKGSKEEIQWTWKDLVELVKFSQSPLKVSLLSLEGDLNSLAVETFTAIMRYTGDFPMDPQQTEVHCVYFILMNCHKHETLRDEVYCQIMKQTTNNKSSVPESCQRGWRLFSIIAAYFTCSDVLKPYLIKYLETNSYDKRRAFHGTAMVCLQNIRKTFRYGGRKNVPSIEEITAITAGRNSKRQIYRLPGGTERVINTKSTSVVQDILEELCSLINVRSPHEQEEFSLYCIVEGDTFTMPLAREEYVLDVTTELLKNKQIFYLVFCRSVYYYPLRLDNPLYIEVVFNQIAPDYLAGFLLVTPGEHLEEEAIYDIAKIAALMHRAADLDHIPTIKEVKYLLPRPLLKAREVKPPAWVSLVQGSWPEILPLSSIRAKAAVLEILQNWPLFGSAFFDVERITEPEESIHTILALNKRGVHFLDPLTHETLLTFSLDKIMSTRKVKGNDGELYLDMKCGNLMKPRIITVKSNQGHEISRQIRQYITIEQRSNETAQTDNPRDVTLTR